MAVFATAAGVPELVVGRVAAGAVDRRRARCDRRRPARPRPRRGTVANAVAPLIGTAVGALGSGLLVQFLPAPTQLVYVVLLAVSWPRRSASR